MTRHVDHIPANQRGLIEEAFGMPFIKDGECLYSTEAATAEQMDVQHFLESKRCIRAEPLPASLATGGFGLPILITVVHPERLRTAVEELRSPQHHAALDDTCEALANMTGLEWTKTRASVTCKFSHEEYTGSADRYISVMRDLTALRENEGVSLDFMGDRVRAFSVPAEVLQIITALPGKKLGHASETDSPGQQLRSRLPSQHQRGLRVILDNMILVQ